MGRKDHAAIHLEILQRELRQGRVERVLLVSAEDLRSIVPRDLLPDPRFQPEPVRRTQDIAICIEVPLLRIEAEIDEGDPRSSFR
jgi:hypothetical protein